MAISVGNPGQNQNMPWGSMPPFSMPGNTPMPGAGGPGMPSRPTSGAVPVKANTVGGGSPIPNPYQVPSQGGPQSYPWGTEDPTHAGGSRGKSTDLGHNIIATGLQYPGLSQDFANYIMSQIGAGMTPFDLSTNLPSGGQTQPGQLTAGLNPMLSQLMNFFMTGQGGQMPGMSNMANIANNGISALPEWQSMIGAQQQNIQQNQANLAEQFGSMGNLAGSPFGTAMSNYMSQTTADQNAMLGQLQQQNILQGQIPLMENLFAGQQAMGGGLQALDQQAIQNMYQEFQRVSPQNNPMMPYIQGLSTLFPPTTKTPSMWENINQTLGALTGSGFSTSSSGNGASSTSIQF